MLAYEQAPRQPYTRFRSDRHLGALSATYKNTGLHPSQKGSKTYSAGHADRKEGIERKKEKKKKKIIIFFLSIKQFHRSK